MRGNMFRCIYSEIAASHGFCGKISKKPGYFQGLVDLVDTCRHAETELPPDLVWCKRSEGRWIPMSTRLSDDLNEILMRLVGPQIFKWEG